MTAIQKALAIPSDDKPGHQLGTGGPRGADYLTTSTGTVSGDETCAKTILAIYGLPVKRHRGEPGHTQQVGSRSDAPYDRVTGAGFVAAHNGQYADALSKGVGVSLLVADAQPLTLENRGIEVK